MNQAKDWIINKAEEILNDNPEDYYVDIAHTNSLDEALSLKEQIVEKLNWHDEILIEDLTLSIATHIGPGALAVAIAKKLKR